MLAGDWDDGRAPYRKQLSRMLTKVTRELDQLRRLVSQFHIRMDNWEQNMKPLLEKKAKDRPILVVVAIQSDDVTHVYPMGMNETNPNRVLVHMIGVPPPPEYPPPHPVSPESPQGPAEPSGVGVPAASPVCPQGVAGPSGGEVPAVGPASVPPRGPAGPSSGGVPAAPAILPQGQAGQSGGGDQAGGIAPDTPNRAAPPAVPKPAPSFPKAPLFRAPGGVPVAHPNVERRNKGSGKGLPGGIRRI
jgi:hypothetical protein